MTMTSKLTLIILAAALGGLIVPALAQNGSGGMQSPPDHGMNMGQMGGGMMGGGMMGGGMMSDSMMAGCAEMMQSMNNGANGGPNSQWQQHPPGNPDNGG